MKKKHTSFPKQDRLRKRSDFIELTEVGKRVSNDLFVIVYRVTDTGPKIGITVTKKVGNAVVRNRVKRSVREIFRHLSQKERYPMEMNVIAKTAAATASFQEMNVSLQDLFARIAATP